MKKLTITAKELRAIGFPESPVIPVAMNVVAKHFAFHKKEEVEKMLRQLLISPEDCTGTVWQPVVEKLTGTPEKKSQSIELAQNGVELNIFGIEQIEAVALHQMHLATKLPIAVKAALMPDAHSGYGLPIGGILATDNAVIPYGVGVDIGCRMNLSVFDIDPKELSGKQKFFARELGEATLFGSGAQFQNASDHEVMDREEFGETELLRRLHGKAWKQLGSSGSGNHFVEFGSIVIGQRDETLGLDAGEYVGLLSHSGSRGLGANIANHYTRIAIEKRKLPGEAKNLAWLTLDEEAGIEYWRAMNLAGDYAAACHDIIHAKIAKQLGRRPVASVQNHHNFAWKEMVDGRECIVHRKGGTPAGVDVAGIIPGSMTAPGFIVKGKGEPASLSSASHGAGRRMSRSAATKSIHPKAMSEELSKHGVTLLGGGLDEAPFAYKDINQVMSFQKQLVDIVGTFMPKIVKMCGDQPKPWKGKNVADGE